MWDVIVVGAGPAGSTAATLFARQGLRVLLLDKSAAPPPKACGEYLSPGCLRILDGIGALKSAQDAGARPLYGMTIYTAAGRTLQANYPQGGQLGNLPVHGLAIRRSVLDPIFLDVAITHGAEFEPNFQVSDLVWEDDLVVGARGRHRGRLTTLRGRLIVGADGRNSVVARRLGTVERHRWLNKVALVGHFAGVNRAADFGEIFLGRERYCILNPVAPDLTNVGLVINRRDFEPTSDPTRLLMEAAGMPHDLRDRLAPARPIEPVRCLGPLAYRGSRLAAPGALLIGDAAGFLDPFTGEGIYAGLRSAELAVQSALPALRDGSTTPSYVRTYDAAWRREFLPKWRLCILLQHAIRRPSLADWLVPRLSSRPDLTAFLMAAVGDLVPARNLRLPSLLSPPPLKDGTRAS